MYRFILFIFLSFPLLADDEIPPSLELVPEAPKPPPPVKSGENMPSDITITRKDKTTIQEYRRGGKVYMIKATPDVGVPYYFTDTNGDGKMDVTPSDDQDKGGNINMWRLFQWN